DLHDVQGDGSELEEVRQQVVVGGGGDAAVEVEVGLQQVLPR
ncbi:hypothetical protein PSYJA_44516, partial [Pseudomonas syringae pv. japonica str. M301072]